MSHTPGPWRVGTESTASEFPSVFVDHDVADPYTGMCLARIYGRHDHQKERHANARLIASAPELLAALIRITNFAIPSNCAKGQAVTAGWDTNVAIARQAIAKATEAE